MSAPIDRNATKRSNGQNAADYQRQLAEMLVTLINTRNADSDRAARLLHDEVGQVLSAVGLQLGVLRLDLQDRVPEIATRTSEIQVLLEQAVNRVRELSYELNPSIVERAGLNGALERLLMRFRGKFQGSLRLFYEPGLRFELPIANAMYKISEQAIEDAIEHGNCTQIQVVVKPGANLGSLEIRDNGNGRSLQESQEPKTQISYLLMKFYADQAGLQLSIKGSADKGTVVRLSPQKQKNGGDTAQATPGAGES